VAKLTFRPGEPGDVDTLVALYDRHYRGGYSACFDRYGPATPRDFWWVQSEKSLTLIEQHRKTVGLIVLGRSGRRLLAEEVVLDGAGGDPAELLGQLHRWLLSRFRQERQEVLALRGAETNATVLGIARAAGLTFVNALIVAGGGQMEGALGPGEGRFPHGYHLRRARPADARSVRQLHEETIGRPLRPGDLEALWTQPEVRVVLAEREEYPVGFLMAQVRDGAGRWIVGVREAHRGKGLGRALARDALQFFQSRHVPAITTYWGTDGSAVRFARALGVKTERIYLYFEGPL